MQLMLGVVFGAAAIAFLGLAVCMIGIAFEARNVEGRPFHMRINPLNIVADKSLWTPEIADLHRLAVRFGLAWLVCLGIAAVLLLIRARS